MLAITTMIAATNVSGAAIFFPAQIVRHRRQSAAAQIDLVSLALFSPAAARPQDLSRTTITTSNTQEVYLDILRRRPQPGFDMGPSFLDPRLGFTGRQFLVATSPQHVVAFPLDTTGH